MQVFVYRNQMKCCQVANWIGNNSGCMEEKAVHKSQIGSCHQRLNRQEIMVWSVSFHGWVEAEMACRKKTVGPLFVINHAFWFIASVYLCLFFSHLQSNVPFLLHRTDSVLKDLTGSCLMGFLQNQNLTQGFSEPEIKQLESTQRLSSTGTVCFWMNATLLNEFMSLLSVEYREMSDFSPCFTIQYLVNVFLLYIALISCLIICQTAWK